MEHLEKKSTRKILSVLSKEGGLKILEEAISKLISRRETPSKIGLTKRQYYTRLRELKNLDVIKKEGEGYVLTHFGEVISNLALKLEKIDKDGFKVDEEIPDIDSVEKSESFVSGESAEVIRGYDSVAEKAVEYLEKASDEVLLASKYLDHRVVNALIGLDEDVDLKLLGREFNSFEGKKLFNVFTSPKKMKKAIEVGSEKTRIVSNIPFTFMVRDKSYGLVELVNPLKPDSFFVGFTFRNEEICDELRDLFERLYESSEKNAVTATEKPLSFFPSIGAS